MFDWASRWALYSPEQIAVKEYESGRTLTYGQLHRMGAKLAAHSKKAYGLRKGDRIAVLAENCLEYVVLFSAAQKAGFILVPLNYRLAAPEIDYLLRDAGPRLLIVEGRYTSLADAVPACTEVRCRMNLEELIPIADSDDAAAAEPAVEEISEDDPIFILYTSGTTGFPKGALYTHKMLFWNSVNTALSLVINTESRTINVMPPFHTGGWNVLLTPFLHHGAYTCLLKKFDPPAVLRALEAEQCTLFMGVPTMLKMLADDPYFERADLSRLLYVIVGGEPMPIPLIERWHRKGVYIRQGYGMTEAGPNLTSLHQRDAVRKKGSIGRPNFYVQVRIVDTNGRDLPPNQAGELLLKGPMVTPGYWRNPDATAAAIRNGWLHTGDMALQDEEGYLYIVDRIKNMFISGGENVYPAEVERALLLHPAVAEAAVTGVPDDKWGEVGCAFIVCRPEQTTSPAALIEHCRNHLARFKVPRYVRLVDALPKTDSGKIDRKRIAALAKEPTTEDYAGEK